MRQRLRAHKSNANKGLVRSLFSTVKFFQSIKSIDIVLVKYNVTEERECLGALQWWSYQEDAHKGLVHL